MTCDDHRVVIFPFSCLQKKVQNSIGLGDNDMTIGKMMRVNETMNIMKDTSRITVYTFCNARLNEFPKTAAEAIKLVNNFPDLVNFQRPHGVPIKMEITPIAKISKCGRPSSFPSVR